MILEGPLSVGHAVAGDAVVLEAEPVFPELRSNVTHRIWEMIFMHISVYLLSPGFIVELLTVVGDVWTR